MFEDFRENGRRLKNESSPEMRAYPLLEESDTENTHLRIAMFLVTSLIVINVPTRGLLAVETMTSFVQRFANLNIKRNLTSVFVNKKYRYSFGLLLFHILLPSKEMNLLSRLMLHTFSFPCPILSNKIDINRTLTNKTIKSIITNNLAIDFWLILGGKNLLPSRLSDVEQRKQRSQNNR